MINQQLIDLLFWATNLEAQVPQLKMLGEPKGPPEIFPRALSCSSVVIGSMILYMLLLNVEVHFLLSGYTQKTPYKPF